MRPALSALFLTVAGWSLIWGKALSIADFVPLWFALMVFGAGLALIPFVIPAGRKPS